jgi:hypothetical protein
MPDLDLIENVTQLSPPALLAVALYGLGFVLKKSPMPDWLIPFVLPCVGAVLFPFIADTASVSYTVKSPAACAGLSGYEIPMPDGTVFDLADWYIKSTAASQTLIVAYLPA